MMYIGVMLCNRCKSNKNVKNGHRHGKQSYLCKTCGYQFTTDASCTIVEKRAAITLYNIGLSFRKIGALLKYSHVTILNWVNDFAKKAVFDENDFMELDEIWAFLESRRSYTRPGKRFATIDEAVMWNAEKEITKILTKGFAVLTE